MQTKRSVLHVGCGTTPLPKEYDPESFEETRYDIDPSCNPDIVGPITDLYMFPDNSFDALYCAHTLEHVYAHQVLEALLEFKRVLRPNSWALIIVPDLQSLLPYLEKGNLEATLYESEAGPVTAADLFYGHKGHMKANLLYMSHKYGFTRGTMHQWCKTAGFAQVRTSRIAESFELHTLISTGDK